MTKTHALNIEAAYFDAIWDRTKRFEVRFDDRGFAIGDDLLLARLPGEGLGRLALRGAAPARLRVRVTYVLNEPRFGLQPGWVILGLADPIPVDACEAEPVPPAREGFLSVGAAEAGWVGEHAW